MEKLYVCDNVIFQTKRAAEEYAQHVCDTHNLIFKEIREWYIDKAEREMTPLEKKKHKMKQRLEKMQEDFE
jgi:hypothetical protein